MSRQVLVIEDNADMARLLALHLAGANCTATVVHDGDSGLREALRPGYELVVLDLMLPGIDGLEICRRLRAGERHVPILMLTARSSELDRVLGLELGADDYLAKPFSVLEFVARVKALLRRAHGPRQPAREAEPPLRVGALTIDSAQREVRIGSKRVDLTAREFELLRHFARHPGRVMSRGQLLDQVWGYTHSGYEHTVNTHINRLRAKIEPDPARPHFIRTVWGVGYRFCDPHEAGPATTAPRAGAGVA